MKIAFIGGGVMGEALLAGALKHGIFGPADATVAEIISERRDFLANTHGVSVTADANAAMDGAEFVVLAVKPQDAHKLAGSLRADAVLVSIMAGVTVGKLTALFNHDRIVRVMPNTPAAIGAGMSAWTATPPVSDAQRTSVRTLLQAVGREVYVEDEKKIDMATAVSGSGPAYVFLFIEALIDGAVGIGLPRAQAEQLALETVAGAARYASESGMAAAELRARVTSPAGTTAAGLLELEKAGMRAAIMECVSAAHRRAVELGKSE